MNKIKAPQTGALYYFQLYLLFETGWYTGGFPDVNTTTRARWRSVALDALLWRSPESKAFWPHIFVI